MASNVTAKKEEPQQSIEFYPLDNYQALFDVGNQVQWILVKHNANTDALPTNDRDVIQKTGFEETCDFLGEINEEFVPVQQADQVEVAQHDIPQMNQEQLEALLSPQVENVYGEVLYSILHGSNTSYIDKVFKYLKCAFQFDDDKHEELLSKIRERAPPDVSIQLGVLEARISKVQYEQLLNIVVEHEIRSDANWQGQLPNYLFSQFAAHRGLRQSVTDVCSWSVYSTALHKRILDFTLLFTLFQRLRKAFNYGKLPEEELVDMFWAASDSFTEAALSVIRHFRNNPEINTSSHQISSLLECLKELQLMWPTRAGLSDIEMRITEAITEGMVDWYSQLVREQKEEDTCDIGQLKNEIRLTQALAADLETILFVHEPIFQGIWKIPVFSKVFSYYDVKLTELTKPLVCRISETLKSIQASKEQKMSTTLNKSSIEFNGKQEKEVDDISPQLYKETALFELYLSFQHIHKLSNSLSETGKENLKFTLFYTWFETAVDCWLDIALNKALIRIGKAVSLDNLQTVDGMVKYSSSAVDTMTIFYGIKTSWEQLVLPDVENSLDYVNKVVEDVKQSSSFYAEAIQLKLEKIHSGSPSGFFISPNICAAINSILHVQQSIKPLAEEINNFKLNEIAKHNENYDSSSNPFHTSLTETAVKDNINDKLDEIYIDIAQRFEVEVFRLIDKMLETDDFGVRESDEFNSYICNQLLTLDSHLPKDIFLRVYKIITHYIFKRFVNDVNCEVQKKREPVVYRQWNELLNILNNCFRNPYDDQDETIKDEILTNTRHLLNLHSMETSQLIHLYRLERTKRLDKKNSDFGSLALRVIFIENSLNIEVLNARNLTKLDSDQQTGDIKTKERRKSKSINPFVKVQLLPTHLFPDISTQKSKVHKNTSFPLFEGSFTFPVPKSLQTNEECYILFTVKDKNLIGISESLGESFLSFQQVFRCESSIEIKELDQIILPLTKLPEIDSEYLNVLKGRTWDKIARDFVKQEKKREK